MRDITMMDFTATPFTEELLDQMGFTPYNDENGTWGNRRLVFRRAEHNMACLQIMEYGDFPEDNEGEQAGYVYYTWYDNIRNSFLPTDSQGWHRLHTLQHFVDAAIEFRPELIQEVSDLLQARGIAQ
jgi:hypothetical protein